MCTRYVHDCVWVYVSHTKEYLYMCECVCMDACVCSYMSVYVNIGFVCVCVHACVPLKEFGGHL